jgi:hypothetical protein
MRASICEAVGERFMYGKINNGELAYSLLPPELFHDLCERLLPRVRSELRPITVTCPDITTSLLPRRILMETHTTIGERESNVL